MKRTGFRKQSLEEIKTKQASKRLKFEQKRQNTLGIKKTRKTTLASQIRRKKGIWATSTADSYFSKWVRARDGKCLRCQRTDNLTCSHYIKRAISITRFDPENCIALCGECHALWEGPREDYTNFMITYLGVDKFLELQRRGGRFKSRSEAVAECKLLIKNV